MNTFTESAEEDSVFTTELYVSKSAAQQGASSIESAENSDEEPTSVSKYFLSDIFTEVDELEDMDLGQRLE